MKIAVVGSGGREHAILWRLWRDAETQTLFALPGNGGTGAIAQNVAVDTNDVRALRNAIRELSPDLTIIGPEVPLAAGISDLLQGDSIACFGPSAKAARIECSKVFAKNLMQSHGIPTAKFEVFRDYADVERFVAKHSGREGWVVKADGLAAGKGAYVCSSLDETLQVAHALLVEGRLGAAGATVVLEERLAGREVSALYLCDGTKFIALPPAQDYKRAQDGDQGPNTGGMGSYCPAAHLTTELKRQVESKIIAPVLRALAEEDSLYCGVLYAGLMLTEEGPKVIEFNCRFGDPETQVILPVLRGNLAETLLACVEGRIAEHEMEQPSGAAVCVVLAADGYPDSYKKSILLREIADTDQVFTFHAGTVRKDGALVSSGGRVLNAVGVGTDIAVARGRAYELASRLQVSGLRFRSDIALGV